ncbi:hypothetical protein CASFOL_020881 [Castilleja foliolosa]|uniref:WAT1-related protein n=1 Tax=Castilleja foliolosa TaxID=1961234 RepID=A0ABD3D4Z3_9LAMI
MELLKSETTPYLGMVLATTAQVGMATGMTNYTFVAAIILLPLSLLVHRSSNRPPLTFLLVSGFLLGVLGCLAQLTGYSGINYTSAAFASAIINLIPGFTFILAIIFRMEKLACKSSSFIAKTIGTLVSISGAFIVTLFKGPQIPILQSYIHIPQSNLIIGGLFLAADCLAASAYINRTECSFTAFFAAILSTIVSLIVDKDLSAWALQPNIRLIAVLHSGVFGTALQVSVSVWCLRKKGPLFVAMFHPRGESTPDVCLVQGTLSIVYRCDRYHLLGRCFVSRNLVGSTIIVIGVYSVMWGKSKEVKVIENSSSESSSVEDPLLPAEDEHTNEHSVA